MKKIITCLLLAIGLANQSSAQCEQNSTFAMSFSWGTYQTGAVLAIEGYSWGIDRATFFGGGLSAYNEMRVFTHPETKEESPYKEVVADAYMVFGAKLVRDLEQKFYTTVSGSASVKGSFAANVGFYYQPGDLILIGIQPGYHTKNGMGLSFKTIFRF